MAVAAEIRINMDEDRAKQLCKRIRQNMTDARDDLVELYEGEGWTFLGYTTWRDCVAAEFGQHQATLYRQLEAAQVAKELEADPVFRKLRKTADVPDSQLRALSKAPEGVRAEVFQIAAEASEGKPTEAVVKAAVEAKKADPTATPAELVKAVVERKPKPKAVVPEVVEDVREEKAEQAAKKAELTDDEWLASLPLDSTLSGHVLDKFRRDALDYRDLETTASPAIPLRRAIAEFHGRTKKRQKGRVPYQGFVASRAALILSVEHPRSWFPCPPTQKGGCGGTGTVGAIGECPMCRGRGYLPR